MTAHLRETVLARAASITMNSVPARWSSFHVALDDPQEPASALCCVVSAGVYLGSIMSDDGVAHRVIARLDPRVSFIGMNEKTVRALARAAGLNVWRPNRRAPGISELAWRQDTPGDETLWMALLRSKLSTRATAGESSPELSYVLVLEVTEAGVVVADPRARGTPIYVMPEGQFLEAWEAARKPKLPKWAGCLGRRR